MANVVLTSSAKREFDEIPYAMRGRVANVLDRLQRWPNVNGAKSLRGNLAGHYRIRTGDYRVQFYPSGEKVIVEKVGHRDGFYGD